MYSQFVELLQFFLFNNCQLVLKDLLWLTPQRPSIIEQAQTAVICVPYVIEIP